MSAADPRETPPVPADPHTALVERLLAMRADLVAAMVRDGYSAGLGAMLAGIAAALAALDAVACSDSITATSATPPAAASAERAVVANDGQEICLTLYRGREALAAVTLDAVHAIGLAGEPLAAAHLRLARAHINSSRNGDDDASHPGPTAKALSRAVRRGVT